MAADSASADEPQIPLEIDEMMGKIIPGLLCHGTDSVSSGCIPMQTLLTTDDDDVEIVPLALPLDRATISWLNSMSRNDVEAAQHIADMIREIREADEAHERVLN